MRPDLINKLRSINPEQMASLLRTAGQIAGGMVVQWGWANDAQAAAIFGALTTIGLTLWGMWARSDKNLIVSAASVPAVDTISVDKETELASATLTENPKVNA